MDHTRFDAIARTLAGAAPRRQALRLAFGGTFAALLGARSTAGQAQPTCVGAPCSRRGACCRGTSCISGTCQVPTVHRPAAVAAGCPTGQLRCAGTCVDPQTDESNCGGCGQTCRSGATCLGGACQAPSVCLGEGARCSVFREGPCCCAGFHCDQCATGTCDPDRAFCRPFPHACVAGDCLIDGRCVASR